MQKLKKALKKITSLGKSKVVSKSAQPAKKASSVKKKTQPVAKIVKKGAAKKPVAPIKKATAKPVPAKGKAPQKVESKDAKKKVAVVAAKPALKAAEKPAERTGKKVLATVTPAAKKPAAEKSAAAPQASLREEDKTAKKKTEEVDLRKARKPQEEEVEVASAPASEEEIVLTDADGRRYCRVKDCDQTASVDSYCRYHYLLFWKNIQVRKKILSEGKLERYIEELTARYPDKYLEMLRKDLKNEKDFIAAIQELEIDDSGVDNEYEDEAQSYLEEVRGMSGEAGAREEEDF